MGKIRKPVIGITVAHCTEELKSYPRAFYVESIRKAGGQAILLPLVKTVEEAQDILVLVDGLILSGGGDISPVIFKELPQSGIGGCLPDRDQSEILLAQIALQWDKPILGICRGIQVLAIAAGGKIIQDIFSQCSGAMQHQQTAPREYIWHEVELLESRLKEVIGQKTIGVNSLHHQAVLSIPDDFRIDAIAADGIIEGIEKIGARFCIGVQWHPEALIGEDHSAKLFTEFVESCMI
jgi:putative glutamine amidotransferase